MIQLLGTVVDCPDPLRLATFYAALLGRPLLEGSDGTSAGVDLGGSGLTFQRVEDHRPPRWPDEHPKHHLDLEVDDLASEQRRAVGLGATLLRGAVGPDGFGWQVYADPAGHPFCLCRHQQVSWREGGVVWG